MRPRQLLKIFSANSFFARFKYSRYVSTNAGRQKYPNDIRIEPACGEYYRRYAEQRAGMTFRGWLSALTR